MAGPRLGLATSARGDTHPYFFDPLGGGDTFGTVDKDDTRALLFKREGRDE